MTNRQKLPGWTLCAALAAVVSVEIPTAATAHAGPNCTVPGASLEIHHSTGYDVTIAASGVSLGPTALVRSQQTTSRGNVTGGVSGRSIDFTINWFDTKAYVHFTGTIGADGFAHGTSTGTGIPVKLDPGTWDSTTALTC